MMISEFSKAVKNILCLMDAWSRRYGSHNNFYRPPSDSLSNTPMTEALIACQPLITEFKTVNNLDIVNLCVVHDGDADDINAFVVKGELILVQTIKTFFCVTRKTKRKLRYLLATMVCELQSVTGCQKQLV